MIDSTVPIIVQSEQLADIVPPTQELLLLPTAASEPQSTNLSTSGNNSSDNSNAGENTGRWTNEEHLLFLQGLEQHGKGWKKIASLIKSRTVVQIRTHAQKYFQKLAKTKQNNDDLVDGSSLAGGSLFNVTGNARSDACSITGGAVDHDTFGAAKGGHDSKKKRPSINSKKRKAISSVVSSALKEGKKVAISSSLSSGDKHCVISGIAPTLTPFVQLSRNQSNATEDSSTTTLSGSVLEESLFRFLTPHPGFHSPTTDSPRPVGNVVPNIVSSSSSQSKPSCTSTDLIITDGNPVGVSDPLAFPLWVWADLKAEPTSWFARGGDVDDLLNDADALDWLADTGDLNETYEQPQTIPDVQSHQSEPSLLSIPYCEQDVSQSRNVAGATNINFAPILANSTLSSVPSITGVKSSAPSASIGCVGALPSLSSTSLFASATDAADANETFSMFDAPFDEQAFVTSLLEQTGESFHNLSSFQ